MTDHEAHDPEAHRRCASTSATSSAALLGVYGVILVLMGLFGDPELDKTGDVNANLWAGLALVVAAAVFLIWAEAEADRGARTCRAGRRRQPRPMAGRGSVWAP